MLILSRRVHESLLIGDDIEITVVRLSPRRVRLAINAPDDVRILRKEIQYAASASTLSNSRSESRQSSVA